MCSVFFCDKTEVRQSVNIYTVMFTTDLIFLHVLKSLHIFGLLVNKLDVCSHSRKVYQNYILAGLL